MKQFKLGDALRSDFKTTTKNIERETDFKTDGTN